MPKAKSEKDVMSTPDPKDIDALSTEAIVNIRTDRAAAQVLLVELMGYLVGKPEQSDKLGMVASKYLEVLQRSNEQLVKLTDLSRRRSGPETASLSKEERESLLDEIQNG